MGRKQNLAKAIREIRHILTKPPDGYDLNILRPFARKIGVVFAYGPTAPEDIQSVISKRDFDYLKTMTEISEYLY